MANIPGTAQPSGSSIFQPLPKSTYTGPGAGIYLERQNQAEYAYQQAIADLQAKKNTAYHQYGLTADAAVDPNNRFGEYQSLLSQQEQALQAADEQAQQRHLGGPGLGMQGETGLRYGQGQDSLRLQQAIADVGAQYATGSQQALGQRNQSFLDSQLAALSQAMASGALGYGSNIPGGGGGGSGDLTDFIYGSQVPSGFSDEQMYQVALANAPAGATPMHLMNQGMVQNGQVSFKYRMPDGTTNTIWVPLPAAQAPQTAQPNQPTSVAPPPPSVIPGPRQITTKTRTSHRPKIG